MVEADSHQADNGWPCSRLNYDGDYNVVICVVKGLYSHTYDQGSFAAVNIIEDIIRLVIQGSALRAL